MKKIFAAQLIFCSVAFSQDVKVYFNQSVDNSVSLYTDAQTSIHLDDTICKLIDGATTSLDIAVWDNGSDAIVTCINDAYNRGVQIRYITSSNAINSALSNLNSNIPVLTRNSGLTSNVMHNKFIIVDQIFLLTGSMNFGDGSIFDDFNNVVLIHDPSMCINYKIEFDEMWGSNGATYNLTNSKFGPDKTDNTIHSITIGGIVVESYFSPSDQTTAEIIQEIDSAEFTLDIAMFTFLNNDLSDAVIAAHNRGVEVRCIIENINYIGSEYNNLINAGIDVLSHDGIQYDFHHKYCIIDAKHVDSDPTVITGSHNWTNSAEEEYDENTLMIHDPQIAWQYLEEFSERWQGLGGTLSSNKNETLDSFIYPNPTNGILFINQSQNSAIIISIYDLLGQLVFSANNYSDKLIDISFLQNGVYIVCLETANFTITEKLIVQH